MNTGFNSSKFVLIVLSLLSLYFIGLYPLVYAYQHSDLELGVIFVFGASLFFWIFGWIVTLILFYVIKKLFHLPDLTRRFVILVSLLINILGLFSFPIERIIVRTISNIHESSIRRSVNPTFSLTRLEYNVDGSCAFDLLITNNSSNTIRHAEINFTTYLQYGSYGNRLGTINLCATNYRIYKDLQAGSNLVTGSGEPTHFNPYEKKSYASGGELMASGYLIADRVRFEYKIPLDASLKSSVMDKLDMWFQLPPR